MAIHNTAFDAANTAVRAFLTKVGAKYWGRTFNIGTGSGKAIWHEIKNEVFGGRCCYCSKRSEKLQIEHLVMFNRVEYGLHHPGNVAPVCGDCNKRGKDESGKHLSWEQHLRRICTKNKKMDSFESRRLQILKHITEGKFAYPKLSKDEKNSIRVIAESLYNNITSETENSLLLYEKITEAFVKAGNSDRD